MQSSGLARVYNSWLRHGTYDSHGTASFNGDVRQRDPAGQFAAATASDPGNNTSAFSNCVTVPAGWSGAPLFRRVKTKILGGLIIAPQLASRWRQFHRTAPFVEGSDQPLPRRATDLFFERAGSFIRRWRAWSAGLDEARGVNSWPSIWPRRLHGLTLAISSSATPSRNRRFTSTSSKANRQLRNLPSAVRRMRAAHAKRREIER